MIDQTLDLFEAEAIPDNHPAVPQLNKIFGDHTFFLDASGLSIVEPADASPAAAPTWQVVKVASWSDPARTSLSTSTLHLADRFGLTLYDAAYLELAQRRSLPLASLDLALCDAARRLGVDLVANHE
jgi:hypothetical protein